MKQKSGKLVAFLGEYLKNLQERIYRWKNPPQHVRLKVIGESIDDCLRKLEEEAELPKDDLYIVGEPLEVSSFPLPRNFLKWSIDSKTSESWRKENKQGYIAGNALEATGPNRLSFEQRKKFSPVEAGFVALMDSVTFSASLHMVKNCPGIYRDSVCTTCGDRV